MSSLNSNSANNTDNNGTNKKSVILIILVVIILIIINFTIFVLLCLEITNNITIPRNIIGKKEKEDWIKHNNKTILNIIPQVKNDDIICFNSSNSSTYKDYVLALENFIEPYKRKICSKIKEEKEEEKINFENCSSFYPCRKNSTIWANKNKTPCIIIHFNNSSSLLISLKKMISFNIPKKLREYFIENNYTDNNNSDMIYCHKNLHNIYLFPFNIFTTITIVNTTTNCPSIIAKLQLNNIFVEEKTNIFQIECSLWKKEFLSLKKIEQISFKIKYSHCDG